MPTAAKLVAAVLFAIVSAVAAFVYIPLLPEGTLTGWLVPTSAAIGMLAGWWVMGPNVGRSYAEGAATGVRTSITALFFTVLGFSIYTMILRSTKMLYDGPMEAVLAVFGLMIDYGKLMGDRQFLGVLGIGGMVSGLIAEFAGRRWK